MQTAVGSLNNGCFTFAGAKGLEKLMVRYFKNIADLCDTNDLFYRSFQKLLMLEPIVISFQVIGFSIPEKRNLAKLSLMVWLLTCVIIGCVLVKILTVPTYCLALTLEIIPLILLEALGYFRN